MLEPIVKALCKEETEIDRNQIEEGIGYIEETQIANM